MWGEQKWADIRKEAVRVQAASRGQTAAAAAVPDKVAQADGNQQDGNGVVVVPLSVLAVERVDPDEAVELSQPLGSLGLLLEVYLGRALEPLARLVLTAGSEQGIGVAVMRRRS